MPRETSDRGGIARTDVEGEAGSGVIAVAAVRSSHPSRPSVLERIVHRAVQTLFLCYEVSRLNTVTQTARRGSTSQVTDLGLFKPVAAFKSRSTLMETRGSRSRRVRAQASAGAGAPQQPACALRCAQHHRQQRGGVPRPPPHRARGRRGTPWPVCRCAVR